MVFPIDDHEKGVGLEEVDAPPGADGSFVALRVRGDSMWPAYRDGDIIFYEDLQYSPVECAGRDCVVRLTDGQVMLKVVAPGSRPGLVTLQSHNAPPIVDAEADWLAPVRWIERR